MCISGEPFTPTGDIIKDICERYRQLNCDVKAAAIAAQVEKEARQAYGRERLYIQSGETERRRRAMEQVVAGESSTAQAKRLGITRKSVWIGIKRLKAAETKD
jgi:FixJ family two-component response regulator